MHLINYDFYDLYAVIICVRSSPNDKRLIPVLNSIAELIEAPQSDNGIESNIVRKAIRQCCTADIDGLSFANTDNVYTANIRIMKNPVHYKILSKIFRELSHGMSVSSERPPSAADSFHNIPLFLSDEPKQKKAITLAIKEYRPAWEKQIRYSVTGTIKKRTVLYFEGNKLKKYIYEEKYSNRSQAYYEESDLDAETDNRQLLLPKTSRGRAKPLNPSLLRTPTYMLGHLMVVINEDQTFNICSFNSSNDYVLPLPPCKGFTKNDFNTYTESY